MSPRSRNSLAALPVWAATAAALLSFGDTALAESGSASSAQDSTCCERSDAQCLVIPSDSAGTLCPGVLVQADGRSYIAGPGATKGLLRRARPTLTGKFHRIYQFKVMPDFGQNRATLVDAYVAASFKSWLTLTLGKFKPPVGLERLQRAADIRFIERALPSDLVPNRDAGVLLGGGLASGKIKYAVGFFNGIADGMSSNNNPTPHFNRGDKGDIAARIFFHHLRPSSANSTLARLGFGIAGTYAHVAGSPTHTLLPNAYDTSGQQKFFNYLNTTYASGERLRAAPQLYYYRQRLGFLAEYTRVRERVARLNGTVTRSALLTNYAWQAQLSWLFSGGQECFDGVAPNDGFGEHRWGVLELVLRAQKFGVDRRAFSDSYADPTRSAQKVRAAGIGVNWYLDRNLKWTFDYELTRFKRGAPEGDRAAERALFTRFQIAFP